MTESHLRPVHLDLVKLTQKVQAQKDQGSECALLDFDLVLHLISQIETLRNQNFDLKRAVSGFQTLAEELPQFFEKQAELSKRVDEIQSQLPNETEEP